MKNFEKGIFYGLLCGLFSAGMGIFSTLAMGVEPLKSAATIALIAAPVMTAFFRDLFSFTINFSGLAIQKKLGAFVSSLKCKEGRIIVLAGLVGGVCATLSFFASVYFAGPFYAVAITNTFPALGAIGSHFFLKEKLRFYNIFGILLCIGGSIAISYTPPSGDYPHFILGIFCGILASLCYALEGLIASVGMKHTPPELANVTKFLTGVVVYPLLIIPFMTGHFSFAGFSLLWETLQGESIVFLLFIGMTSSIGYPYYYKSIHICGSALGMALSITNTFWVMLFSCLFLSATLTLPALFGTAFILLGVIFVSRRKLVLMA